jgi:methyl-accepting chemotaxis protein
MNKKSFFSSIKTKMVLLMLVIVAVPIIFITMISTLNSRRNSINETTELNTAQARIVEENIDALVKQNIHALKTLSISPNIVSYLSNHIEMGAEERITNQMKQINDGFGDNNSIAISGKDGMQKLRSDGEKPVDVSEREYFKQAIAGNEYISDITVSKSTGLRIVTLSCPVKSFDGNVIGIVQRNYNLSVLHELLASLVTEDQQELVIVDNTGSVIAHSGHEIDPNNPEDMSQSPYYTDSRGDNMEGDFVGSYDGKTWMISWEKEAATGWVVASCRVQSVALRSINITTLVMILMGLGFMIIFGVIAYFISRSFTLPIKSINDSLSCLSDGRFVKITQYTNRKDEFGDIVRETNFVIDKIHSIVDKIKASASSVNESSERLADMTSQINQTSDDVSNAVEGIANGATHQADEIQVAVSHTSTISNNIQEVTTNADSVSQTTISMNTNSEESKKQLERLQVSSDKMSEAINDITEKISATEAAVERISTKVEAINSIAAQTNLLALNASIEAARADEAGRGFAVVAEEIGNLADESAASANEIQSEMNILLEQSQSAVTTAKKVNEIAEVEQKAILSETVSSIAVLIKDIEDAVAGINSITVSAENCENSKVEITNSMSSLSAISEENAAASEETAASMEELNAIVNSLADDSNSLREISNNLIEDMKFFKD